MTSTRAMIRAMQAAENDRLKNMMRTMMIFSQLFGLLILSALFLQVVQDRERPTGLSIA
jgi:hypothetical protein